jgi:hypothetical protein
MVYIQQFVISGQQTLSPSERLGQIEQLELTLNHKLQQLDLLNPQTPQYSPLVEPHNIPVNDLRQQLEMAKTALVTEKEKAKKDELPLTDISVVEENIETPTTSIKEELDKRTSKEHLHDLVENTENLLKDEDMSYSKLVSVSKKSAILLF